MRQRGHSRPPKLPYVEVKVTTWVKDSHGLYDYQAAPEHYHKETIYLENECRIYRNPDKNQTIVHNSNNAQTRRISQQSVQIGTLTIDRTSGAPKYKIRTTLQPKIEPQLHSKGRQDHTFAPFAVVRGFKDPEGVEGYPLEPGNVIKLGRVEFMVIEIKNNEETLTLRDTNHFQETNGTFEATPGTTTEGSSCKVCLCDQQTEDNPLIAPCNCKGSCQVIHVGCLRTWINSKVKKEIHGIATSFNFTKFQCEICKFPFPKMVKVNDHEIEMMKIEKPEKPYIMLESLSKNEGKQQKCLHLISSDQNAVKIGRGHTCQIRVTDISVSRSHAEIAFQNNRFYIKDLGSKFGTLVKFNEEFEIEHEKPLRIQLGRTLLEFELQRETADVDTE